MVDRKTGFLFPEIEKAARKKPRKRARKTVPQQVLSKIHSAKDRQTRLKIIQGVAKSRVSWVHEVLLYALEDPCEKIREFIIQELGAAEKLNLNLIYKRIQHPPWYVKTGCLKILALQKKPSSVKHIEPLTKDPNIEVRRTAARVLGEIGGKDALALLANLSTDTSAFVRASAEQALKKASNLKFSG
ncbi:MAG: HEAT repeat domain-containing protein [Candidatus Aminicenantales bacterium]